MDYKTRTSTFRANNGIIVSYKHKPAKYDFNHTVFVFSGFGQDQPDHYNFLNVLEYYPGHVIWINDNFENLFTYYMCISLNFDVADAVEELICSKVEEFRLGWKDITLLGGSKGGSAAIYHGLKMNIHNIIACVPQIKIGTFLNDERPFTAKTANHMMGSNYTNYQIQYLDNVIPNLLKKDYFLDRNIYILTSEYDDQYAKYLQNWLEDFEKYKNFNLLKTYSLFVQNHAQITEHHFTLILGILYSFASEAIPYFPEKVNFFGSQPVQKKLPSLEPYIDLQKCEYRNEKLFIQGIGILRGVSCSEYTDIEYTLIFKANKSGLSYEKELAKSHVPSISRHLFNGELINYDKGFFTTIKYAGLDISNIPKGTYSLLLKIKTKPHTAVYPLHSNKPISNHTAYCTIHSNSENCLITII